MQSERGFHRKFTDFRNEAQREKMNNSLRKNAFHKI